MLKGQGFVLGTLPLFCPVSHFTTAFLQFGKLPHEKVGIDVISVQLGRFCW